MLACPLTFNSVNKFAHGHADNFAVGLLCEMAGYGVPMVVVPHCKPQLASHPAFAASIETLRGMGVQVLFDPDAPEGRSAGLAPGRCGASGAIAEGAALKNAVPDPDLFTAARYRLPATAVSSSDLDLCCLSKSTDPSRIQPCNGCD